MHYRSLGRSGLKVSAMSVGTLTFGGTPMLGETDAGGAARQLDLCFERGVNLVDTANIYSQGRSEEIVGKVLSENGRRHKCLLATKVRLAMGKGPNQGGLSRQHIIEQCEQSLKRLKTDVIDLYQVHEWDGQTPLEETLGALDSLVEQGKVRYIGCSNFSGWQAMKALGLADAKFRHRFISQQIYYSLQGREAEFELVQLSLDQGLGILVWSPLAGGLLSGKYGRDHSPEDARHTMGWKEPPIYDREKLFDIVDVLKEVAQEHEVSCSQVALAWLLQRPCVTSVIIGGRTHAQFSDNLGAANLRLTPDQVRRLDAISQPDLPYPYWHQNMTASERFSSNDLALYKPYLKK